jgi:Na+-driven multidrug efflux pump
VLDYLFVMVFRWGVAGAAWATGIAQLLSTLLLLSHFLGKRARLRFSRFEFRLEELLRSVRLGFGDAVTEFSVGAAIFLFNRRILQIVGAEGGVSYTVMAYVTTLVVMTMSGISQGMQPLLSYQYGRGDEARCRYLLSLALKTAVCCSIAWFALMEVFTGAFVRLFIDAGENAALLADSVRAFRIYAVSYLFIGVNVVLATYFSSVERPIFGVALSASRGLFVIAVSLFAMSAIFGELGIWLSPVVSEVACLGVAAFCLHALRSGKGAVRAVETA